MSEENTEQSKSDDFEFKILTKEAKLSLLYQMMQDLETDIYGYELQQPMEEDPNYEKEMEIVEVDDEIAIKTCKMYNYKYTVVTPNDIIIPPKL